MAKITHYFCTTCNPSNQVRDEGHEIKTGYAVVKGDDPAIPLGWWGLLEGVPPDTHLCPECVLGNPKAQALIERKREAVTREARGEGDWPSHTSPFGTGG